MAYQRSRGFIKSPTGEQRPQFTASISLQGSEYAAIQRAARAAGWSVSYLFKRALSHYLGTREFATVCRGRLKDQKIEWKGGEEREKS